MPNRPIEIASDVLRRATNEPQVRRNAVTALGVLGTADAAVTLAGTAVDDDEPSVREHAAAEMLRLPPGDRDSAAGRLRDLVHEGEHGERAYELLGRMRSESGEGVLLELGLRDLLRLESRLNRALLPKTWWRPRSGSIAAAMLGTGAAFALVALLVAWRMDVGGITSDPLTTWGIYSGLLALALAALTTLRLTPIGLHPSRTAGLLVEMGWVVLLASAGSLALAPLAGSPVLLTVVVVPLFAAVVRAGSVLGATGRFHDGRRRLSWGTLTGGNAGLLLVAAVVALLERVRGDAWNMLSLLFFMVPVAYGLAFAYARGDHRDAAPERGGTLAQTAAGLIALASAALLAMFLVSRSEPRPGPFGHISFAADDTLNMSTRAAGDTVIALDTLPFRLVLNARANTAVTLKATDRVDGVDVILGAFGPRGERVAVSDEPPSVDFRVKRADPVIVVVDRYDALSVARIGAPAPSPTFATVVHEIARRFSVNAPTPESALYPTEDTMAITTVPVMDTVPLYIDPTSVPLRREVRVTWHSAAAGPAALPDSARNRPPSP